MADPRRMTPEEHGRAHSLSPAVLDVGAHGRNELHLGLHVTCELVFDLPEVVANRLEHERKRASGGFLRGGIQARQSHHTWFSGVNARSLT